MEQKKKVKSQQKDSSYVETIREGAIAANIFLGQANDGFSYHYYVLSRSWRSAKQSSEGYSNRFFPRNAEAIGSVAIKAAARCEELDASLELATEAAEENKAA